MPNPSGIRPLPDKPAEIDLDDPFRRPDGSWDTEAMNAAWDKNKAEGKAKRAAAAKGKRKRVVPEPVKPGDYPWMKPGWKW